MKGSRTIGSEIRNCCWMMRAIKTAIASFALAAIAVQGTDSFREQGIAAFQAGRYSAALEYLKKADAKDPSVQAFVGLSEAALNHCPVALPRLLAVEESQGALLRLASLAAVKCYSAGGDSSKAFAMLDSLQRKFPNDPDVLYLQAKLHMKAFNDATYAMFQRAPGSYRVHELSAEIFEVENRYSDAVAEYRKAIELNPAAPDLHFRLGRALLLESHEPASLQKAAAAFQDELKLNPEDGACEFQLGQIAQVQGLRQEARQHMERALALSPNFVQALIALGKMDTQEKQYQQAIARLVRATELQPSNETAHYALLTAYRDSGDLEKAKTEKEVLDRLQKPPAGEFTDFLNKLGEKPKQ
jgi:tetratricopeptide (TPR) repeat protein